MRALWAGNRLCNQTVTMLVGSLALSTAFGTEPAPRADAQSAVLFGTESRHHTGQPVNVTTLRVNYEEYILGLALRRRQVGLLSAAQVAHVLLRALGPAATEDVANSKVVWAHHCNQSGLSGTLTN